MRKSLPPRSPSVCGRSSSASTTADHAALLALALRHGPGGRLTLVLSAPVLRRADEAGSHDWLPAAGPDAAYLCAAWLRAVALLCAALPRSAQASIGADGNHQRA